VDFCFTGQLTIGQFTDFVVLIANKEYFTILIGKPDINACFDVDKIYMFIAKKRVLWWKYYG